MIIKLSPQDIRRYNWYIWRFVIACFSFVTLLLLATAFGLFGQLPTFRDLENPKSNLASVVYSSDQEVLGTYFVQNRSPVTYKEISPYVMQALIATEDSRFESHSGIDFNRTFTIIF